jgi:hypothetical protein
MGALIASLGKNVSAGHGRSWLSDFFYVTTTASNLIKGI